MHHRIYEGREHNVNTISVAPETRDSVIFGTQATLDRIVQSAREVDSKCVSLAFDGWYGIEWPTIIERFSQACAATHMPLEVINSSCVFKNRMNIREYKAEFITDDPAFGWENRDGEIADLMDSGRIESLRSELENDSDTAGIRLVVGPGSAAPAVQDLYDIIVYFDKLAQHVLPQMWDHALVPFGWEEADPNYQWKEYHYCDYHLLLKQKLQLTEKLDFYVDALGVGDLKLLPRSAYDDIVATLIRYPIKLVEVYQGGPWGAYRFKQIENIEGLECNAWHTLVGPDLSMEVDFGADRNLNLPFSVLMQHPQKLVGEHISERYPMLFPFQVGLDDGWHPEPTPRERTSMPMHNHPGSGYVRRHFNEPLGRYETYYIAEAYEAAGTFMGYKDGADLDDWERKCRDSDNDQPIPDWQNYVELWSTKVGDLFLIPPGTCHGHGGNQMVLEMDTCPSIAGNEYSFFLYDYARNTWDDCSKTMTGKPMRMHLDHGFDNEHWRRASYVGEQLRAQPTVVTARDEYCVERYSTIAEMPFHIERVHYYDRAEYSTEGRFLHICTLTRGKRTMIRSLSDPELTAEIARYHCATIPAGFGDYELVSQDGGFCTVVILRWKQG